MKKTNVNDIVYHYAELDLALICEDAYKDLSHRDIVLFTLLKNQESLSLNTVKLGNRDYVDSEGNVFIKISQEKLSKILKITEPTLRSGLKTLEKLNLIETVKLGKNQCSKIYVGTPTTTTTYSEYIKNIGEEIEIAKMEKAKEEVEKPKKKSDVKPININDFKKDNKKDLSVRADKPSSNKNSKCNVKNSIAESTDDMQEENNEKLNFIKEQGIIVPKNTSEDLKNEVKSWDMDLLLKCTEYMYFNKSNIDKFNINYLAAIYRNPKFITKEVKHEANKQELPTVKTRFHNINSTFNKYTPEELEIILFESQRDKFK